MNVRWNAGKWLVAMALSIGLAAIGNAAQAYNVSGTIQNSTGNGTSRVYVVLMDSNGTNTSGYGTTIASIPVGGSSAFTIRGVPAGNYSIGAFMDVRNTGSFHINDPGNGTESFSVSGNYNIGTLILPAVGSPTLPTPVNEVNVVTTTNGALVVWEGPKSSYGGGGPNAEQADSYVIYWGTAQKPGDGGAFLGSKTVPATGSDYHVFVSGLTPGASLYFGVKSVVNGSATYAYNSSGPYPIAAGVGGATVSGRVYSAGITKTGKPLYIAMQGQTPQNFYIGGVASPVPDVATWTITGVQPDTYSIFVILDLNNDGFSNVSGYALGRGVDGGNAVAPFFTVLPGASAASAPDVTLTAPNSHTTVNTQNQNNASYQLQFRVNSGMKRPVSAVVNSGPNISGPIDLGISLNSGNGATFGGDGSLPSFTAKPVVGDTYSVTVGYSDATSETLSPKVTGVVTNFPSLIFPQGTTGPLVTNSTPFAWTTPGPPPTGYYDYSLWMNSTPFYNQFWYPQNNSNNNMPATQLSILYNSDGTAPSTVTSGTYSWGISVNDGQGNYGWGQSADLTVQGSGPAISGFSPASGPAGTSVTINGNGLSGASNVSFGGVSAAVTFNNGSQIIATVPANAPVGPITVTAGGVTAASSTSFKTTVTFTGGVQTSGGTPISGATVTVVNSYPVNATTTNGSGVFTVTVPSGVPFAMLIHDGVHRDTLTQIMVNRGDTNASSSPYKLYADGDLTPYSVASKGLIYTSVRDWDNPAIYIQGATVTATSFLHPDTPYTVSYTGGGSVTSSDGIFYVPNVDEGDIVTVKASKSGYYAQPRTYLTRTGVVTQGKINTTPLPVVTANPSGGAVTASQQITLQVGNAVPGNSYIIYYTTDGTDPTTSGSRQTYSGSFTLNVGSVTLKFYAVNTTHNDAGSVATASYTVSPGTYGLTVNITGSGSVTNTNGSGPTFSCNSTNCSQSFSTGSLFTLSATPANSLFNGWSGGTGSASGCSGTADCSFTLNADTTVTASFIAIPPVKISGPTPTYFASLSTAYASLPSPSSATMLAQAVTLSGDLNLSKTVQLLLKGGYDSSFGSQTGFTTLQGLLTIGLGSLTVDNLVVSP